MHEISLVRNIFAALKAEFSAEDLKRLKAINLKVGRLSNVEPTLMQNAFHAVISGEENFIDVQLNIELVPIVVHCNYCDTNSIIENYKFVCATCGQPNNNLISGTELYIHQVLFDDHAPKTVNL